MPEFTYITDLGEGAFGKVMRVSKDGVEKAIKVIRSEGYTGTVERTLTRFNREIRIMVENTHPGIMPIEPTTLENGLPAYYMPVAESSLSKVITENPRGMAEGQAVKFMLPVLEALEFLHQRNIVHRDLKPDNILILDARPVISDFGLTRELTSDSATMTHLSAGTTGYMAPEQHEDAHNATSKADIYAAGVVLHELLCGEKPISGLVNSSITGKIRVILNQALQRNPNRRHQTAEDFSSALQEHLLGDDDLLSTTERLIKRVESESESWTNWEAEASATIAAHLNDAPFILWEIRKIEQAAWNHWAEQDPTLFEELIPALTTHMRELDGFGTYDNLDHTIRLVRLLWKALSEDSQRIMLMQPLAEFGVQFNRYLAGRVFAELVAPELKNPSYLRELIRLLGNTDGFSAFVRHDLNNYTLPGVVREKLS